MGKGDGTGACRPAMELGAAAVVVAPAGEVARQNSEASLERLRAHVDHALTDEAGYKAWLERDPLMTVYPAKANEDALEQLPYATRIAGERAWRNRGRRVKPDATPLTVTSKPAKVQWTDGSQVYSESFLRVVRPEIRRRMGLRAVEVEPAKTQVVYDVTDTEPLEPVRDSRAERVAAERGIRELTAAARALGVEVVRGNERRAPVTRAEKHAHKMLMQTRDAGGQEGLIRFVDGETVRFIAIPGGLTPQRELRAIAHELGHRVFDHAGMPGPIRSRFFTEHEVEAEAFAWALCDRYGVRNEEAAFYIRNHCGADAVRKVTRAQEKVLAALGELDAVTTVRVAA